MARHRERILDYGLKSYEPRRFFRLPRLTDAQWGCMIFILGAVVVYGGSILVMYLMMRQVSWGQRD